MPKKGHIILDRIRDNGIQTIGQAWALVNGSKKLEFVTLEPSWVLNMNSISCAPIGTYQVHKRYSKKYKNHFHLQDVPDRSYMLIHAMNFFNQTEGCIGVGSRFKLLNDDQYVDVIDSQVTMDKLNKVMPDEFQLSIKQNDQFQRMYMQG
jgi:hypothetical protein